MTPTRPSPERRPQGGVPAAVVAARYLEELILGKVHALKVAARQLSRLGIAGMEGEE